VVRVFMMIESQCYLLLFGCGLRGIIMLGFEGVMGVKVNGVMGAHYASQVSSPQHHSSPSAPSLCDTSKQ
jgi:hypothetical protein